MLYRSFCGAADGSTLQLTPTLDVYFGVHGAVLTLEVVVLVMGLSMLKRKAPNRLHGKLVKIFFGVWWFAFLSGEIVYLALYVL